MKIKLSVDIEVGKGKDSGSANNKSSFTSSSWARIRRIVARRDNHICQYCGVECKKDGEVDHVIPLSRGGDDDIDNLCWSCQTCNRQKGNKTASEFYEYLKDSKTNTSNNDESEHEPSKSEVIDFVKLVILGADPEDAASIIFDNAENGSVTREMIDKFSQMPEIPICIHGSGYDEFFEFAESVIAGVSLSNNYWTGYANPWSASEFNYLIRQLIVLGIIKDIDGENVSLGKELSVFGTALFDIFVNEDYEVIQFSEKQMTHDPGRKQIEANDLEIAISLICAKSCIGRPTFKKMLEESGGDKLGTDRARRYLERGRNIQRILNENGYSVVSTKE